MTHNMTIIGIPLNCIHIDFDMQYIGENIIYYVQTILGTQKKKILS